VEIITFPPTPDRNGVIGQALETGNALAWTLWHCLRLRLGARIDVLHGANPPDTFFVVALVLRLFGTRFVYDQHDLAPELASVRWGDRYPVLKLMRFLERRSYRAASLVITPNASYREVALLRGALDPHRVVVVRNGPRQSGRMAIPPPSRRPLVVSYGGVMGPQDGVEVLLRATAEIESRRPGEIKLVLIGDGRDVVRLRRLVAELRIEDVVEWTGWLDGEAYTTRLHSAHVGVSPELEDDLSLRSTMIKITEYVAGGMPAVVADLPESRVTAGEAALYFRAGDAADLARRLEELMDRPELLDRLAEKALLRGPELVWAHSGEQLVAAYSELLGGEPQVAVAR